ncbi:hypothetical protein [Pseudolysinimonas yzui]|uniref:Uncharacterized protein n=1 Tax=Pseudolysinimonas yzui TaxID=2708254 RepID=A0A8J3GN57_9MICO|nr:hypothetical protein [Pseudolysinimonas yzui]GHF06000.1 hypothetical protein GCM10011600_03230 [Pseudolysinimonas yzui]
MSDTDVYVSPTRVPATIALLLGVIGTAGMAWSFVNGISAALDSSGSGAGAYVAVFLVAAALVVAGLVISIVCLARGLARGIATLALLVAIVPVVAIIVIRIAATA